MTIGYGYLIVVTNSQCHVYNVDSIQTPYCFDLKEKVKSILTCPKYFALIDDNNGINVFLNKIDMYLRWETCAKSSNYWNKNIFTHQKDHLPF